jgi:hypothetical protein
MLERERERKGGGGGGRGKIQKSTDITKRTESG